MNAGSICSRDLIGNRCGNQDVARHFEDAFVIHLLAVFIAFDEFVLFYVFQQRFDIEAIFIVDATMNVGDANNFAATLMQQLGRNAANIAASLNYNPCALQLHSEKLGGSLHHDHDSASGSLTPSFGSAETHRLSSNNRSYGASGVHAVCIHDPGHHLFIRVDVRRRNVFLGTENFKHLCCITASNLFQLFFRHNGRITFNPPFCATERNIDNRALHRHPRRKSADFVQIHIRGKTDAPFCGTSRNAVLDTITGEDFKPSVIHLNGQIDGYLTNGVADNLVQTAIDIQ